MDSNINQRCRPITISIILSVLSLCSIPTTTTSQSAPNTEHLSGRIILGIQPVRAIEPPENTQLIRLGFHIYFNGPKQSKLLLETSYDFWQAGESFVGQTSGIPQWPPDQSRGYSVSLTPGIRLKRWPIGNGEIASIACLSISHQTEQWTWHGWSWRGSNKHSEWRLGGELRLHLKINGRPMTPILELGAQWYQTLKNQDDCGSLVDRHSIFGSLLIPIASYPYH